MECTDQFESTDQIEYRDRIECKDRIECTEQIGSRDRMKCTDGIRSDRMEGNNFRPEAKEGECLVCGAFGRIGTYLNSMIIYAKNCDNLKMYNAHILSEVLLHNNCVVQLHLIANCANFKMNRGNPPEC